MDNNTTVVVQADPADVEQNKVMAILAYILFFIPWLAAKESKFAMYHANQGLILFLFALAGNLISGALTAVLIGLCLWPIVLIIWLVLAIMGIMNAMNGQMKPLPVIGNFTLIK
jgi:uncharacterized membrane protein